MIKNRWQLLWKALRDIFVRELGKRLKTRIIPALYFQVDESIAYGVQMIKKVEQQIAADEQAAAGRPPIDEGVYKE